MTKFYALAIDQDGDTKVITNLPESRIKAVNAAISYCKKNNLMYKEVRPVKGTERQGGTLTKMSKEKKNRKLNWFAQY